MPVQIQQLDVVQQPATPPAPRRDPPPAPSVGDEAELERRLRDLEQQRARLRAH